MSRGGMCALCKNAVICIVAVIFKGRGFYDSVTGDDNTVRLLFEFRVWYFRHQRTNFSLRFTSNIQGY